MTQSSVNRESGLWVPNSTGRVVVPKMERQRPIEFNLVYLMRFNQGVQEVLLGENIKRGSFNFGFKTGLGGKRDRGERIIDSAKRELLEESGIRVEPGNLKPIGLLRGYYPYEDKDAYKESIVHLFSCWTWIGVPQPSE